MNRYTVHELRGYLGITSHGQDGGGMTIWIADEALYGREVWSCRTEDLGGTQRNNGRDRLRHQAQELCDRLNADDQSGYSEPHR